MVLSLDVYHRGLEHGRAAEIFEPPLDPAGLELYEAGYSKGFAEMLRHRRGEKLDHVD